MDEESQRVLLQEHGQLLLHLPPQLSVMSEEPLAETSTFHYNNPILPCTVAESRRGEVLLD